MSWQKRIADLCTAARAPLTGVLVWLGIDRGEDGIQVALVLLLVAITLDTLDGYFARLSPYPVTTWVGSHDLAFDIVFSMGLLLYLSLASYLSPYLAGLYAAFWIVIFWTQDTLYIPAVLFQAPIYVGVVLAAVIHNIELMLWMALWAGIMLALAGKRFFHIRVPAFFNGLFRSISNSKH